MRKRSRKSGDLRYVKKAFYWFFSLCMLAVIWAVPSFQASASDQNASSSQEKGPPEFVDINIQKLCPDLKGLRRDVKSVNHFSHEAHIKALGKASNSFVCATCHNGAKTEEDILDADRCGRIKAELDATGGPAKLKDHFHNKCIKCHRDLKKAGQPTGPTSCRECHNRKGAAK